MKLTQLGLFEPSAPSRLGPDELFARANVELLVSHREDRAFERKPAGIHANELGEYISMWANTKPDGGLVVIGIENDGTVSGCLSGNQDHINKLEKAAYNFCPDARAECKQVAFERAGKTDFLLIWRVRFSHDKLIRHVNGKAYRRDGDSKVVIREDEAREIERERGQTSFEQEDCGLSWIGHFGMGQLENWVSRVIAARNWGPETSWPQVLTNMHLGHMRTGQFVPNMACALLFALDPCSVIPGTKVHLLRFSGESEGTGEAYNPAKDEFVEGTVPYVIDESAKWIESQLRTFTRQGSDGKFYTSPEYPRLAWYEALVNACVHRSYGLMNTSVSIKIFDDRMVFESPGGFPAFVTSANIYDIPSTPRNPHLFQALWYFELVRCNNEGAKRIRDNMASMNLPEPEFKEHEHSYNSVRVTLRNNEKHRRLWVDADAAALIGKTLFESMSQDERRVVNFVAEYEKVNVSEVQRLTQLTWPAAKRLLLRLEKRGILTHFHRTDIDRDPQAYFILRRPDPA